MSNRWQRRARRTRSLHRPPGRRGGADPQRQVVNLTLVPTGGGVDVDTVVTPLTPQQAAELRALMGELDATQRFYEPDALDGGPGGAGGHGVDGDDCPICRYLRAQGLG